MDELIGHNVVVDTETPYLYIGNLTAITSQYLVLQDVDVHDRHEADVTRDEYIVETCRLGIRKNRAKTLVMKPKVVSVSKLSDILRF